LADSITEDVSAYKRILIGCPRYRRLVSGSYACDASGEPRLGANGEFLLAHVRCGQRGGRCTQTLCALHRHNRGGKGSWYPSHVFAGKAPRPRAAVAGEGYS